MGCWSPELGGVCEVCCLDGVGERAGGWEFDESDGAGDILDDGGGVGPDGVCCRDGLWGIYDWEDGGRYCCDGVEPNPCWSEDGCWWPYCGPIYAQQKPYQFVCFFSSFFLLLKIIFLFILSCHLFYQILKLRYGNAEFYHYF